MSNTMSNTFLSLPSPAKINLFLRVLERREDGYHNLQTSFQFVDVCDHLTFYLRKDGVINLKTPILGLKPSENLIVKAASLLHQHTDGKLGVDISIDKHIPMGAGLGGGSSNAATTLMALNQLWRLHLPQSELLNLGAQLGADVPVFIFGHAAWGEGVGDVLTPMILPQPWYLLIDPKIKISTTELFQDAKLKRNQSQIAKHVFDFNTGSNDFEPIVLQHYPPIAKIFDWLAPFSRPRLTGTGSIVYAAFDTRREASTIASLAPKFCHAIVARGLNSSPLLRALAS
jgi:4-diphosphocytidyl-2-C-methyl-D-erythritol kinase